MPSIRDYDVWSDIWPEPARKPLAPVRVGMDRRSGKMLVGWAHTEQSMATIFMTRFHERIIRQWVGSFVPHLLGKNTVERTYARFFWAMATAIDLWEPNYKVTRIRVAARHDKTTLTSPEEIRRGETHFIHEGVHRPRGHLGDATPEEQRQIGLVPRDQAWDIAQ